jgi:hypothetical protein
MDDFLVSAWGQAGLSTVVTAERDEAIAMIRVGVVSAEPRVAQDDVVTCQLCNVQSDPFRVVADKEVYFGVVCKSARRGVSAVYYFQA